MIIFDPCQPNAALQVCYSSDQLDALALLMSLPKLLYVGGALAAAAQVVHLVEPLRRCVTVAGVRVHWSSTTDATVNRICVCVCGGGGRGAVAAKNREHGLVGELLVLAALCSHHLHHLHHWHH